MRYLTISSLAVALVGCASGYTSGPPGGPNDHSPPKILATLPDSNSTNVTGRELTIHFDKVVSELPAASQATTLSDLIVVSPRDGRPDVDWHRHDIVVHPQHRWRANTAYTVTILPGIADLRGNVMRHPTSIMFSTGATIPATTVAGATFDAVHGTPNIDAVIEAVAHSDTSLVYIAPVDSSGRFVFHGIQQGSYLVRGYIDGNHNHGLDATEPFDSVTVTLKDSTRLELLTFVHDSLGPRLGSADATDSVTIHATFDTPIAPTQRLDTTSFALLGPDSARVQLLSVVAVHEDSAPQPRDTTVRHPDTTVTPQRDTTLPRPPVAPLKPTRPLLVREVIITVRTPLRAKTEYTLRSMNIRGANGKVGKSEHLFTTPAPPVPRDTTSKRRTPPTPPSPAPVSPRPHR